VGGETYSGKIDGLGWKVWDVTGLLAAAAGEYLEYCPVHPIPVAGAWEAKRLGQYDAVNLDHVDAEPLLAVCYPAADGGVNIHVIDGMHRLARAARDGAATIPARMVPLGLAARFEIPLALYAADLVAQEMLASGGRPMAGPGGVMMIVGGSVGPDDPADPPEVNALRQAARRGPVAADIEVLSAR
jgi:hypothetical protein